MKKQTKKITKTRTVRSSVMVPDPEQIGPDAACCPASVNRI
ncbi:MAG: hypothetical protein OEY50_09850 [Nitrospinota bacterium]|nr:hypothetical protein [Nitrospinota bacterium]